MRVRTEGGLSGTYNTPTVLGGSGMWSMRDVERNNRISAWPSDFGDGVDANFNTNMLLLHADGANADTNNNIIDSSTDKIPFSGTNSVFFNGSTDKLTGSTSTNMNMSTGDFTVECWVFWNGSTVLYQNILGSNSASFTGNATFFRVWGTGVATLGSKIGIGNPTHDGVSSVYSVNSLTIGAWNHIAATRSSGIIRVFINGNLERTGTTDNSVYDFGDNGFCIGDSPWDGANGWFGGYISNLRVIKGSALYTASFTPPSAALTAVSGTQLLACQSSTLVDVSANAFTLTSAGTPTVSSGSYPIALTRTSNPAQGTFSPYTVADGYWSNYFDGASFHSIAASANFLIGTQNFTMEFWVNPLAIAVQGLVVSHQTGGMFQFNMTATGALSINVNVSAGASSTYSSFTTTTLLTAGAWTHVAIVRNGTEVACYFNGVKDATTLTLAGATNIGSFGGNKAIYIGASADQASKFTGFISNVRYIVGSAQYTSNFTPSTTPLTAVSGTQLLTCMHRWFRDISSNLWTVTSTTVRVRAESPFASTAAYWPSADGGSIAFNGSSDYARITVAQGMLGLSTGDFTIEFWAYFNSVASGQLVDLRATGASSQVKPAIHLISAGSLVYYVSGAQRITTTVVAGQWYHVAVVKSSGSTKMFVNGAQVGSTYADTNDYGTSSFLTVGTAGDSPGSVNQFYSGYITDVRVTKSAVYTSAFTPPTAPLAAINNTTMLLNCINGKIIDQTSSASLATFSTSKLSTAQSKFGGSSILLNGSSDYISPVGVIPGFGKSDFTIECWIYLNSTAGTQNIVDQRPAGTASNANYATIAYVSNSLNYYTGAGLVITGGALNAGQWYHIALCRSGTSTKLFVNGTQVGVTYSDTQTYLNGTNRPAIGTDGNSPANYFNGYIDELRISRVARYTANFTSPVIPFKNR